MAKKTAKELFEELKVKYVEAYRNLYGETAAENLDLNYKNGYVYFSDGGTVIRVKDLIFMTETLNSRAILAKKEREENLNKIEFPQEELVASPQFKGYIEDDTVALIHNTYYDSKVPYQAYIVIHHGEVLPVRPTRYSITRFFKLGGKIQVSQDHINISDKEVFSLLLTQYSSGLK